MTIDTLQKAAKLEQLTDMPGPDTSDEDDHSATEQVSDSQLNRRYLQSRDCERFSSCWMQKNTGRASKHAQEVRGI